MYDDIRSQLYEQYRDVVTRIVHLSLRDLAESARTAFTDATTIVMSVSDQGAYLVLDHAEDRTGQVVADAEQLEAADIDAMSTAGNLSTDNIGFGAWKPYAPRDPATRTYRLDIAAALTISPAQFTPLP